ncbi:hypothetical protein LG276_01010 [Cytobacillus kochii]|uniref:hypothetical protein n=1 Tax=Cytobacillus kochii TaxID=859143 RepID=UPI00384D2FE2
MNFTIIQWGASLLESQNFWGTILGALVGGIFAFLIAKHQVKASEKHQEKQRQEIVKHEKGMELTRIQIGECRKSLEFLRRLPDDLTALQSSLKLDIDLKEKGEERNNNSISNKQMMSTIIIKLSSDLLLLESVMKICTFSRSDIEQCREFRETIYKTLDYVSKQNLEGYTYSALEIPPRIDFFHKKFIQKQEELIKQLQKDLS